ncbi:uncharacterized protein TNCV_3583361 [Trichonephila clavipes]|nr:uncharacterized protein TNCV_3583361 [Trichonephila clavipes]
MVRVDRGVPREGATCAWMAADETVGCTRAFLRCGGLTDEWSIEGVQSLLFVITTDIHVCKCIVPSLHGGAINSRRAASPLVWWVEGKERWEDLTNTGVLPQNWGGNEPNRTVTCMVLKVTDNDRRPLTLCHDEFRGHLSGLCQTGGISNNNKTS